MPVDMERMIEINDSVYSFNEVMRHIDLKRYFVEKEHKTGHLPYDKEKLLKVVLFGFMENGYEAHGTVQHGHKRGAHDAEQSAELCRV